MQVNKLFPQKVEEIFYEFLDYNYHSVTRKVLSDWWRSASCLEFALLPLLKYHNACTIPDDEIKQDKIYLVYLDSWISILLAYRQV